MRPDEHKQTHSDELLGGQQHIFVIAREVLLQLDCPQLLISGAERRGEERRRKRGEERGA